MIDIDDLYEQYYAIKSRLDEINNEYSKLPNWKEYYSNGDLNKALQILNKLDKLNSKYSKEVSRLKGKIQILTYEIESIEKLNKFRNQ